MVVIAVAVCTKTGKGISRPRMEGLIAAFPKLVGAGGKQHTFIDTPQVRYVYQPMEDLYTVIVTSRASNIVEDLETLQLLSNLVSERCGTIDETTVCAKAFDLIFDFDEVIALGYKEKVTLSQVKTFTEMDSHEEKIHEMVQKNKEREALEEAKRKRKEIERERKHREKHGLSTYGGIGSSSHGGVGGGMGGMGGAPYIVQQKSTSPSPSPSFSSSGAAPARKAGLQLKVAPKANDFIEAMKQETGVDLSKAPVQTIADDDKPEAVPDTLKEDVHVEVQEKVLVELDKDGTLVNFEVRGEFFVTVRKKNVETVSLALKGQTRGVDYKAHPNMDRSKWASEMVLALRDPNRPYPLDMTTSVLKWRALPGDAKFLPISVTCWPSTSIDGNMQVTLEYELSPALKFDLRDVAIRIPILGKSAPKVTSSTEGQYDFDPRDSVLIWRMDSVEEPNGRLEFELTQWASSGKDASSLFPIQVAFSSPQTFSGLEVVAATVANQPAKYSIFSQLAVERFVVQ